ncbi:MAG: cupin domain-containing protein [Paracoccus sp. (in: a-proteobacteria)]|uniref:cupin domain-containing protein n=1 Tax=Paracoccus sp. TaxID=267 RepID=UPI0040595B72
MRDVSTRRRHQPRRYIALRGRLKVFDDDQRRILGHGDAYAFDSHRPHRFRAVGHLPCHVVSASTTRTVKVPNRNF